MAGHLGRVVEIETLEHFDQLVARGSASMRGWRIQGVDLIERTDQLLRLDPRGAVLLGSALTDEAARHLREGGALVFPSIPEVPFDPYRARLYTPEELYAGLGRTTYEQTADGVIYGWYRHRDTDLARTLAQALHDHAIDDALEEYLAGRHSVGVMGGHTLERGTSGYRSAALLGRALSRAGLHVITGGGPGAMEATNLGAYFASHDDPALDEVLTEVAAVPRFRPSVGAWAECALEARSRWPDGGESLGIPTWFYGHEPPNAFASAIAKYFQNALREEILLRSCPAGIIFLPGAGGTLQEIFQDACENYYAADGSVAPMILVGRRHWQHDLPAWPLLRALAQGRPMAQHVHLVDTVDEALSIVTG